MNITCIYEDPKGEIVVEPGRDFFSEVFQLPAIIWRDSDNAESAIKHVVLNPNDQLVAIYRCECAGIKYALTDDSLVLIIKQPLDGRFFMMIDQDCAVDHTYSGAVIVDHCGGNKFPIDPTYTVDAETAQRIATEFSESAKRPEFCQWRPYIDMNVEWDKYI